MNDLWPYRVYFLQSSFRKTVKKSSKEDKNCLPTGGLQIFKEISNHNKKGPFVHFWVFFIITITRFSSAFSYFTNIQCCYSSFHLGWLQGVMNFDRKFRLVLWYVEPTIARTRSLFFQSSLRRYQSTSTSKHSDDMLELPPGFKSDTFGDQSRYYFH